MVITHDDWPGWTFVVMLNRDGRLAGFEMYGDGHAAGADWLVQRRAEAGTLVPPADGPELTARLVRKVPFRDLEQAARGWLRHARGLPASPEARAYLQAVKTERIEAPRGTRWGPVALAHLCAEYVELVDEDPAPIHTLAGRHSLSQKRIRNLLASARGDLLTAPPAGRAGGRLTDKAKELLSGND